MLYKLFTIILCIVILLLVSIYTTNNNIVFMKKELSKPKTNQYKETYPQNSENVINKCSPCVYNSSNNCLCTDDLDVVYSRGGNRN